jgi:hypothetical protein
MTDWMNEWNEGMNEWIHGMKEWMINDWLTERIKQWMNYWVHESMKTGNAWFFLKETQWNEINKRMKWNEWLNEWRKGGRKEMNEWMIEWTDGMEGRKEGMNDWMNWMTCMNQ